MSFSSQIKNELALASADRPCCRGAQLYGMLEMGHSFSGAAVSLQTEYEAGARRYASLLCQVCGIGEPPVQLPAKAGGFYTVALAAAADRARVLERFGHTPEELTLRLNRANLECEECAAHYLRGAFLVCGAAAAPSAGYHLEFSVPHYPLSRDLLALLRELDFNARLVRRKGSPVVYFKESGQIEDCLTLMGAVTSSLDLMNVKIIKHVRNRANRLTNCESANIDKTVSASAVQIEAIRRLEARGGLLSLPDELKELALLRLDNPELSLRELGELLEPPLSRSGVNHRLHRLMELAERE
ncbi:MAG: DNA-binding protein WhiA [Clostridiales bacterium]|nr:DNA-binding protein WhiA [Clostridiales bacterium]